MARGIPIVLRAPNVAHEVLAARRVGRLARQLVGGEQQRLAAFEARALRAVAATVALTAPDAERLGTLAGRGTLVQHVPAPFRADVAPGAPLPGAPAVVLFGSPGWFPNRDGVEWFVAEAWSLVRARLPQARLHVIGLPCAPRADAGIVVHPPPRDSIAAFPRGAIMAVPSRVASGVRMKILEAWARGVVVVATPQAARGLESGDGEALLVAADGRAFAAAIARLHADPGLGARLIACGRTTLRRAHDPAIVAARLLRLYESVAPTVRVRGKFVSSRQRDYIAPADATT
jgi:hypothetical protein